jgi:hypothetical protein
VVFMVAHASRSSLTWSDRIRNSQEIEGTIETLYYGLRDLSLSNLFKTLEHW